MGHGVQGNCVILQTERLEDRAICEKCLSNDLTDMKKKNSESNKQPKFTPNYKRNKVQR